MRKIISLMLMIVSMNAFGIQKPLNEQEQQQQADRISKFEQMAQEEMDNPRPQLEQQSSTFGKLTRFGKKACFTRGTKVFISINEKPKCIAIEDIKVGDVVLSYDEEAGSLVPQRVDEIFRNPTNSLVQIGFENGQVIETTEDHPFHVGGKEKWRAAGELSVGSFVNTHVGSLLISSFAIFRFDKTLTVYDINVNSTHNYFVAGHEECSEDTNGVLVHNCDVSSDFGKGVVAGVSESLPGVTQHFPEGSDAFEAGRATGKIVVGIAEVTGGSAAATAGTTMAGGGAAVGAVSCSVAGCAAIPLAAEAIAAGGAIGAAGVASVAHGGVNIGEGINHFFSESGRSDPAQAKFFENNAPHIFRDAPGHFKEDNAANRGKLVEAHTKENYLGKDKYGNDWYAKSEDGKQIWVSSRKGEIRNGGINEAPREFKPETGLAND